MIESGQRKDDLAEKVADLLVDVVEAAARVRQARHNGLSRDFHLLHLVGAIRAAGRALDAFGARKCS